MEVIPAGGRDRRRPLVVRIDVPRHGRVRDGRVLDAVIGGRAVRIAAQVHELPLRRALAVEDHARVAVIQRLDVEVDDARGEPRRPGRGHAFVQRHGARRHPLIARECRHPGRVAQRVDGRLGRPLIGRHAVRHRSIGSRRDGIEGARREQHGRCEQSGHRRRVSSHPSLHSPAKDDDRFARVAHHRP